MTPPAISAASSAAVSTVPVDPHQAVAPGETVPDTTPPRPGDRITIQEGVRVPLKIEDPLYTPYFYHALRRAQTQAGEAFVGVSYEHNRPVLTLQAAVNRRSFQRLQSEAKGGEVRNYNVTILNENDEVVIGPFDTKQLPQFLERIRLQGRIESIEAPTSFHTRYFNRGRIVENTDVTVIVRVSGYNDGGMTWTMAEIHDVQRADAPQQPTDERLKRDLRIAYLVGRFGDPDLGEPVDDFSDEAALQAWGRVHPNVGDTPQGRARERERFVRFTPLISTRDPTHAPADETASLPEVDLRAMTGAAEVLIKDETQQHQGNFKPRGATNAIGYQLEREIIATSGYDRYRAMTPAERHQAKREFAATLSVVAASHGNHAQGVAHAAREYGVPPARILLVLPLHQATQKKKISACLKQGAMVMLYGEDIDEHLYSSLSLCMRKAQAVQTGGLPHHLDGVRVLDVTTLASDWAELDERRRSAILTPVVDEAIAAREQLLLVNDRAQAANFGTKIAFVHTYDAAAVALGQGTDMQEVLAVESSLNQGDPINAVAAGGLGKIAGDATHLRRQNPRARAVGANGAQVPAFHRSLQIGRWDAREDEYLADEPDTVADGNCVPEIGRQTFAQAQAVGAEAALVSEREIEEAIVFAKSYRWLGGERRIIEGAPASAVAAAFNGAIRDVKGRRLVISLTGRNIDKATIARAEQTSAWVGEKLGLYKLVCATRCEVRQRLKDHEAEPWIRAINGMLADPDQFAVLESICSSNDATVIKVKRVLRATFDQVEELQRPYAALLAFVQRYQSLQRDETLRRNMSSLLERNPVAFGQLLQQTRPFEPETTLKTLMAHFAREGRRDARNRDLGFMREGMLSHIARYRREPRPALKIAHLGPIVEGFRRLDRELIAIALFSTDPVEVGMARGSLHDLENLLSVFAGYQEMLRPDTDLGLTLEKRAVFLDERLPPQLARLERELHTPMYPFFNTVEPQDLVLRDILGDGYNRLPSRAHHAVASRTFTQTVRADGMPGLRVSGDRELIRHVFENLFSNAARHGRPFYDDTDTAHENPTYRCGYDERREAFFFQDAGGDIPPHVIERLGQLGYQAGPLNKRHGEGVGLYNIREFLRRMGGELEIESGNGRTTFFIRLPLTQTSTHEAWLTANLEARFLRQIDMLGAPRATEGLRTYLDSLLLWRRNRLSRLIQEAASAGAPLSESEIEVQAATLFGDVTARLAAASPGFLTVVSQGPASSEGLVRDAEALGIALLPENPEDYGIPTDGKTFAEQLQTLSQALAMPIPADIKKLWGVLQNLKLLRECAGFAAPQDSAALDRLFSDYTRLANLTQKLARTKEVATWLEMPPPSPEEEAALASEVGNFAQDVQALVERVRRDPGSETELATAILARIAAGVERQNGVVRAGWQITSDRMEQNRDGSLRRTQTGIHAWRDAVALVRLIGEASPDEKAIQIDLRQYALSTLHPSGECLRALQAWALEQNKSVTLVIKGDPRQPTQVYQITPNGIRTNVTGNDLWTTAVWQARPVDDACRTQLGDEDPELLTAYEIFADVSRHHPQASRAEFLGLAAEEMIRQGLIPEEHFSRDKHEQPFHRRTQVISYLKRLRGFFEGYAAHLPALGFALTPNDVAAVAAVNPVDAWLTRHQQKDRKGWYSIGAGQMVAMLSFARHLMDLGLLPLDFELAANDFMNPELTYELNETGYNRRFLGKAAVNPKGHRDDPRSTADIYVYHHDQRNEVLLSAQWELILLNLKAKAIPFAIKDPKLAAVLTTLQERHAVAMATPVKSYEDGDAILPYLEIYAELKKVDERLARNFIVICGFFAAPEILNFHQTLDPRDRVNMTLVGPNLEAVVGMAMAMSAAQPDGFRRMDSPWVNLKVIENQVLPAFVNAGGANKNFLTKVAAEELMGEIFRHPGPFDASQRRALETRLVAHVKENIAVSEELTSLILATYDIDSDCHWSPRGLVEDFKNCLPTTVARMIEVRDTANGILAFTRQTRPSHTTSKNLFRQYYASLKWDKEDIAKSFKRIEDAFEKYQAAGEARPATLALLDELIEIVRVKIGGGTRNSRDGLIDAIIAESYKQLLAHAVAEAYVTSTGKRPSGQEFDRFYYAHYPQAWILDAQEGRNGIYAVVRHLKKNNKSIPPKVLRAFYSYERLPFDVADLERWRAKPLPYDVETIPHPARGRSTDRAIRDNWGLETWFVRDLKRAVGKVMGDMMAQGNGLTPGLIRGWLGQVLQVLKAIDSHDAAGVYHHRYGRYPDITRRLSYLAIILARVSTKLLHSGELPPEIWAKVEERFRKAILKTVTQLTPTEGDTPHEKIAENIRILCQDFSWVELAIDGKIDIKGPDHEQMLADGNGEAPPFEPRARPPLGVDRHRQPVPDMWQRRVLAHFAPTEDYRRLAELARQGRLSQQALLAGAAGIHDTDLVGSDEGERVDFMTGHESALIAGAKMILARAAGRDAVTPLELHRPTALLPRPASDLAGDLAAVPEVAEDVSDADTFDSDLSLDEEGESVASSAVGPEEATEVGGGALHLSELEAMPAYEAMPDEIGDLSMNMALSATFLQALP